MTAALTGTNERQRPSPLGTTRNFGVCAHIDAGKTTVTERILYYTGKTYKMGEVDHGTAIMDFLQEEQERGITIQSAATTCPWPRRGVDFHLNLIDTPGHVDFTVEVERSMRVLDGAVMVFDAKEGVEAQSETVWRQADRYNVPRICFINKMDKLGADFLFSFDSLRERLAPVALAVQIPIGASSRFEGIIDLLTMKAFYFETEQLGANIEQRDIPEPMLAEAEHWRQQLLERTADLDDGVAELFLTEQPIDPEKIRVVIRSATIGQQVYPVFCGSALKYIGVQQLLDGIIDYLPNPTEVPPVEGIDGRNRKTKITRLHQPDVPLSALVFKVVSDQHGDLTYVRIYSGTLIKGSRVLNSNNGKREVVSRIYEMHAKDRIACDTALAGRIVALVGLKHSVTGDTLCDSSAPIVLERLTLPEPVICMSIEPMTQTDKDRLAEALITIRREDPSFRSHFNDETGQTLIEGMGELHLEIIKNKLMRDMKIGVTVGTPRVAYKETISGSGEARGVHRKQTGGRGQYGDVLLRVEPYSAKAAEEDGLAFTGQMAFVNKIVGGAIPNQFIGAIETGCREMAQNGVVAGYPMLGLKITLLDGSFHEVDSSGIAFEQAAVLAFRGAAQKAGPVLLEPIMKVLITTPEQFLGNINGDLNARRATITLMEQRGLTRLIWAEAPLSEMFGYSTAIRSMSQGRASYTMEPLTYRPLPENLAKKVLEGTV